MVTTEQVLQWMLQWAYEHALGILVFVGIFVEITPIKISPITWLLNFLFKPIRTEMTDMKNDLNNNITNVKNELKEEINVIKQQQLEDKNSILELIKSNEMSDISRIRWEIIEFSNSIDNDQLHTRDEYRHIIDDNRRYHALITKYGLENGIIDDEFNKIYTHYENNKGSSSVYF